MSHDLPIWYRVTVLKQTRHLKRFACFRWYASTFGVNNYEGCVAHMSERQEIKNTRNNWIYAPLGGFINAAVVEFQARNDGRAEIRTPNVPTQTRMAVSTRERKDSSCKHMHKASCEKDTSGAPVIVTPLPYIEPFFARSLLRLLPGCWTTS